MAQPQLPFHYMNIKLPEDYKTHLFVFDELPSALILQRYMVKVLCNDVQNDSVHIPNADGSAMSTQTTAKLRAFLTQSIPGVEFVRELDAA
jgi:hypothetical protein